LPARPSHPYPVFAVGITGHRPNRLPEAGRSRVGSEIGRILDLVLASRLASYPDVRLALVSGLAEGSDSLAADAALERAIPLRAILPFGIPEYEKDFESADAKACFRHFLSKSASVAALGGARDEADAAYEAAGIAMLDESRMIIAVWDGKPAAGRGGTAEIVAMAIARETPVLWIDSAGQRAAVPYKSAAASCEQSIAEALARFAAPSI
jgi:hypothetical protein